MIAVTVSLAIAVPAGFLSAAPVDSVCARGGMVVSACPIASDVGARILREGGNAVDAAVAVGFALAVTYPGAGNIGGGGFMLVRLRDGESAFIDYREKAPAAASRNMYLDGGGEVVPDLSTVGHLSAGVPGSVAGLYLAHGRYGSLPWEELVRPAVELARRGFPVRGKLARQMELLKPHLGTYPGLAVFVKSDGSPFGEDDTLVQADLARTLERIGSSGASGFYEGETAELILREMERGGGLIRRDDLSAYEAVAREPVRGSYRGYEILSAPPPSSGGIVLLEILNIVERYPLAQYGYLSEETVHVVAEAEKRAYRDRAMFLGDSDYIDIEIERFISKEYAERMGRDITWRAADPAYLGGGALTTPEGSETTHYSIVDGMGNVVSTTTTLNGVFGSMVVVRGAGFLLNNEMDDFSVKPGVPNMYGLVGGEANAIEPGKRMLSSMSPTIVLDGGKPFLVLGSPGGGRIITTVAQIIMNIVDFGMSVAEAVDAPRFHHQWMPDKLEFEQRAFRRDLVDALEERGHRCFLRSDVIGEAQVIESRDSLACGVADGRGSGRAVAERAPSGR